MLSLIKDSKVLDVHYFAQSSSVYYNNLPEYVFEDSANFFHSSNSFPKQWWQVVFFETVSISSYFIKTSLNFGYRPKNWSVEVSFNNKTWKSIDKREGIETGGNTNNFDLNHPVACKFFRFIFLETSSEVKNYVAFTHFDCFGTRSNIKIMGECSCNRKLRNIPCSLIYLYSLCILFR